MRQPLSLCSVGPVFCEASKGDVCHVQTRPAWPASACIDAGGLRIWSQYIADTQLVSTFATNSQAEGGKRHPKCNEQSNPRGSWVYSCHCFYENQNWMAGPRQPSSHPHNRESFKYGPVTLQTRPKQKRTSQFVRKLLFQPLVVDASKVKGRS